MKVYSALYNDFAHMNEYGQQVVVSKPGELDEEGLLILHGGEDISPSLYNQTAGNFTYAKNTPSSRDKIEKELFQEAVKKGIPVLGICRGAQLITALMGGSLIQDVTNHTTNHQISTTDGDVYNVTSAHHQMCNPHGTDHELLAWSRSNLSKHYKGEYDNDTYMPIEPEVIYYPRTKALAVQPHPEWMHPEDEFIGYIKRIIEQRMMS